jgi:autotransporter-associated beta strand protein
VTVTTGGGTTVTGRRYGIYASNYGSGVLTVTANGVVTAANGVGIFARNYGTNLTVTTGPSQVTGGTRGIQARNYGSGALSITANGDVTSGGFAGIDAQNGSSFSPSGTDLTITTGAGTTVAGGFFGVRAFNYGSGALAIAVNGDVTGTTPLATGIAALNYGTSLTVTTGAGTTISGKGIGLSAINVGSGALTITVNGDVIGGADDGIFACHGISLFTCAAGGGPITITVASTASVTSNGAGAGDFAIDILGDAGNVTVAGTLNGGGGGAIRFDQSAALANRLELHPTAIINGNVLGGPGTDTLVLGGEGTGSFNVGAIGPSLQYQRFEIFLKEGGSHWTLTGTTAAVTPWTINQGTLAISSDANLGAPSGGLAFAGGTLQALASFTSNRTVTLNAGGGTVDTNGNTVTLAGTIGGPGGLTKIGAGTLALSNANTYTGATAVTAGTLIVNGSIANSAVTVSAGATLAGTGTVGATTIQSGGTFAPGNSPGTMTVGGNLAFQSGALYVVQVNPSTASSTNVTAGGTATLAGTVQAAFALRQLCLAHLHHTVGRGRAQRHVRQSVHGQPAGGLHREPELQRNRRDPEPECQSGLCRGTPNGTAPNGRRRTRRAPRLRPQHQPAQRREHAQQLLHQRRCAAARLRKHLRSHRRQSPQRALPALRRGRDRRPASRFPAHQPVPRTDARSLRRRAQRRRRRWRPGARFCAGTRSAAR